MVPSSAVKCACCEMVADGPLNLGVSPATFSSTPVEKLPAAFTVESVNFGNATRMTQPKTSAALSSTIITLRYVTVFRATKIPALGLFDTSRWQPQCKILKIPEISHTETIIALLGWVLDLSHCGKGYESDYGEPPMS